MNNLVKMNIINCFCTQEVDSGNSAAIVRYFTGNKDDKQALARKLNLPATVFLSELIDGTCNIEFFYPATEMPLCLHGTIGAAYVLSREKNLADFLFITKDKKLLKTRMIENAIQVHVSSQSIPSISIDRLKIYQMLNFKNDDVDDLELPFLISSVGSPKLLVPVKTFELLSILKPNFDLIAEWSVQNSINGLYVYTKDVSSNNFDFYARGFNPKGGHEEDAATGVAAAALSLALKQSIVVGQGVFLQRQSKIIVSYESPNNIWIGGQTKEQIKDESIRFKQMSENDFQLLHQWFQISHVLKWYARDKKYTREMIKEKYLSRINDETIPSFIIYDRDKPVGYIQFYYLTDHIPEGMNDSHPLFDYFKSNELVGMDFFIADKNYLRIGFSSNALNNFINTYIAGRFKAILVDPNKLNNIAIRFFEKNGFKHILSQNELHNLMIKNIADENMTYTISYDAEPKHNDTKIIWQGICDHAKKMRGLPPGKPFAFFIRNDLHQIKGGCSGYIYYGCLYVDLLWVDESLREQQYGSQLMKNAESLASNNGCNFVAVNTMDFEALDFYKKLGFDIEFERKGFNKNSSMYFLRKDLVTPNAKDTKAAFHWIINILKKLTVPFQIGGGLVANLYGANRPLHDIDIDIPEKYFSTIRAEVEDYIISEPAQFKDDTWDIMLMTLEYKGQLIDLGGALNTKIFNKSEQVWQACPVDFSKSQIKKCFDLDVPVIPRGELISYKKIIARPIDLIDIEQIEGNDRDINKKERQIMSIMFDIPYQPLAKSLSSKSGTKKVTDKWLVELPINQLDPIKLEWLDDIHLIWSLPADSVNKIEKINTDTALRTFLCEGDAPNPSPDGQWIVFVKSDKNENQLWLIRPDGTQLKQLTYIADGINFGFYKYNFNLVWSHNSNLIALMHPIGISQSAIDIVDIHTGKINRILITDQFQIRSVFWSLDDKELFFWKEQTEGDSAIKRDQECIQAIRLDDGSIRTLIEFDGLQQMLNPVLSPDGKNIAITYDSDHPYFDTTQHIGLVSTSSNNSFIKQLTHELKLISQQWSPDGRYIYALRIYGAYKQIYRINVETGHVKQITDAPFSIDWRGYALSPDGTKLAFSAINAHGDQVVRVTRMDGQSVCDLMTIPSVTDDMTLSEVREIEWDTMNYPARMRGLFILPIDYKEGISYPLIVDIHGGGSGASLQLDGAILVSTPLEWQMWAAKGYAVFVPEFRSSGAFGGLADTRDHYEQHDLINQDVVDIECGVKKLISDGFIDSDRVAVIAHSAGARRANWLIASRHQFRAVISKEGWVDELHTTLNLIQTYPLNRVYQHFGGSPQEVPENYLKNSALHYAKDVMTPTLFLMGNPEQGGIDFSGTVKLFHDIIKEENVATELISYSDEGHVFKKSSNRLDALKRSQEWIDKHMLSKK